MSILNVHFTLMLSGLIAQKHVWDINFISGQKSDIHDELLFLVSFYLLRNVICKRQEWSFSYQFITVAIGLFLSKDSVFSLNRQTVQTKPVYFNPYLVIQYKLRSSLFQLPNKIKMFNSMFHRMKPGSIKQCWIHKTKNALQRTPYILYFFNKYVTKTNVSLIVNRSITSF